MGFIPMYFGSRPDVCETNLTSRMESAENIITILITTQLRITIWHVEQSIFEKICTWSPLYQPVSPIGVDGELSIILKGVKYL